MQINFNGFPFGFKQEKPEMCLIEIFIGTEQVEQAEMPLQFAKQEVARAVKNISNATNPMKIVCSVDYFTDKEDRHLVNSLTFENKLYMDMFK